MISHRAITPDSWFAVIWERLVLVSLLIVCFVYTFIASFSISFHAIGYGETIGANVLFAFTYILDLVFVVDFFLRFNMATETKTGEFIIQAIIDAVCCKRHCRGLSSEGGEVRETRGVMYPKQLDSQIPQGSVYCPTLFNDALVL